MDITSCRCLLLGRVLPLLAATQMAVYAQTVGLSLAPVSGQVGSAVSIPLTFAANGTSTSAVMWTFSYSPSDITAMNVAVGPVASGTAKNVQCNSTAVGSYTCIISGMNA